MSPEFTDDDIGKTVVNADDEEVGMVTDVEHGTAHVEADPGITDTIKAKLGWGGTDESAYPLQEEAVARVTDDAIHLERELGSSGTRSGRTDEQATRDPAGDRQETGMDTGERATGTEAGMGTEATGSAGAGTTESRTDVGDEGMMDSDEGLMGDDDDDLIGDDDDDLIGDEDEGLMGDDDDDLIGDDDDDRMMRDDDDEGLMGDDDDDLIGDDDDDRMMRDDEDEGLMSDDDDEGLMGDDDDLIGDDDEGLMSDDDDDDLIGDDDDDTVGETR